MSGLSAKRKGSAFEREFARGAGGKRTPLSGATGGGDVRFEVGELWHDWSWELKRRATLPVFLTAALAQAAGDIPIGDARRPAVAMREDHGRTIVAFYWDDLRPWVAAIAEVGNGSKLRALIRGMRRDLDELERATR